MKKVIVVCLSLFLAVLVNAQSSLRVKHFNTKDGLAVEGYDPVAYFKQNKAVKGQKQFSLVTEGITYYFSSAANRDLFIKSPKNYEPQYGGWCAYAMGASGQKVEVDPETFKIVDGKLFLFYHTWVNNTLKKWNENEKNLHQKADKNWMVLFR